MAAKQNFIAGAWVDGLVGDVIGFCTPEQVIAVAEQVVMVQRDWGDRTNRAHARLKYTIEDRGLDAFRAEVERRAGHQDDVLGARVEVGLPVVDLGVLDADGALDLARVAQDAMLDSGAFSSVVTKSASGTGFGCRPAATSPATTAAADLRTRVPGVVVLDQSAWNTLSATSWARWFRPFTVTGYLIAAAGGIAVMNMLLLSLLQQRRTRATLRTVGRLAAGERLDIVVQALIVGVLFSVVGALVFRRRRADII